MATRQVSLLGPAFWLPWKAIDHFAAAFDTPLIKKWHWMLHLPDSLARHGLLPNCFASERTHKPIGALANNLQNQNHFEQHLLSQVVAKEISFLDQPNLFPEGVFLLKAKDASKKVLAHLNLFLETPVDQALSSHFAKVRGATCSSGDVVLLAAMCTHLGKLLKSSSSLISKAMPQLWSMHGLCNNISQESNMLFALHPQTWGSFPQKTSWHQ